MAQVTTVCPRDCYDTCALLVTLDAEDQITSLRGDPSHPVTQGFACPRGAQDHRRLVTNRVTAPFLRREGAWVERDWDSALDEVSRRLRAVLETEGPEAVLYLDYAGNTGLLTSYYPRRLWYALGAAQTDRALCSNSGHAALALHYGASYGVMPAELAEMRLIVFWGFNAAVSAPHLWALARKARRRHGTQIVVIDPRESRTAKGADLWVQPQPGSDVALAYGIIQALLRGGYADRKFLAEWTTGFEQLQAEAQRWSPERGQQVTGVSPETLAQLVTAYGERRPSATMLGIGLQKRSHGAAQVRAASFIPAILGQHRGFFYSNGSAFDVDTAALSGRTLTTSHGPIVSQVALADLVEAGSFKFIYISGMNPALTLPNQRAFRAGLTRSDVFMVVHETHWTETARYANVVLAAPTYLEKDDVVLPWTHPYVQLSPQVVLPSTDARRETVVMQDLARRLGREEPWLYEDPWQAVSSALAGAFVEGDFRDLQAGRRLQLKTKPRDFYPTPSGKIEFYTPGREVSPLPQQATLRVAPGRFTLLTSASANYTSTQFQEVYGPIPPEVTLNTQDATHLGLKAGDVVILTNERGSFRATVRISDSLPRYVIWAPRQYEGQNSVMSSRPQTLGHGPRFNSTTVTIIKLTEG